MMGAAWLMVSLHAGPGYVALVQTAAALPYFLLALPAGSAGDIFDRRKLVLSTEVWMMGGTLILAVLTMAGPIAPWLLLALTFALSAGDAFETPTWRAILPELVSKDDLAAASALNGIEFNLARAVGPAAAGMVIAVAGCIDRLCRELHIILRGSCCNRQMEKTDPKADGAGRNIGGSHRRRASLRPQFPCDSYASRSDGHRSVLFQVAVCVTAFSGQKRGSAGDRIWATTGVLRGRCDRRCLPHATATCSFLDRNDCLGGCRDPGYRDRSDHSIAPLGHSCTRHSRRRRGMGPLHLSY
jgi:hypothetical protein